MRFMTLNLSLSMDQGNMEQVKHQHRKIIWYYTCLINIHTRK